MAVALIGCLFLSGWQPTHASMGNINQLFKRQRGHEVDGDPREVREEMEGGARVAMVKIR